MDTQSLQNVIKAQCEATGVKLECNGAGPIDAKILIIAEAPGETEIRLGLPLVGGSGKFLWEKLKQIGVYRQQCYITNVVKRHIIELPDKEGKSPIPKAELQTWEGILQNELKHLRNIELIICCGGMALHAITGQTGIKKWRGSVFVEDAIEDRPKRYTLITFNPAFVLRELANEVIFKSDIHKAKVILAGDWKPYVVRAIINPTFAQAVDYIKKLDNDKLPISVDIETVGGETACIGIGNNPHEAICIPFRTLDGHYFSRHDEVRIRFITAKMLARNRLVAQNGGFDSHWLWYKDRIKLPPIWFDTLLAHHALYSTLPHNLGFLTTQYTSHPYYKDEKDGWKEVGDINRFWEYNCLSSDTPTLMHDLTWKRLGDVSIGDTVTAFEEDAQFRRFFNAVVTNTMTTKKVAKRYHLSDGSHLDMTDDHRVLVQCYQHGRRFGLEWFEAKDLQLGYELIRITKPWDRLSSFDHGWLSGIFDGEGTISVSLEKTSYLHVSFSQKEGAVLNKACTLLDELNIPYYTEEKANAVYVGLAGKFGDQLRYLGMLNPIRLINNYNNVMDGSYGFGGMQQADRVKITLIEDVGIIDVTDITTSEGTFIANGYAVHNCKDVAITRAVQMALHEELRTAKMEEFFFNHVMKIQPHLIHMTVCGVKVDTQLKERLSQEMSKQVDELRQAFNAAARTATGDPTLDINPNSRNQLADLFFNKLKLVGRGGSTDDTNRARMLSAPTTKPESKEVLLAVNRYKKEHKFFSTYVETGIDEDGVMRCDWKQYGVKEAPGRLSSSSTLWGTGSNMQNQPERAREMYVAEEGYGFVYFDLAQAEARVVSEIWDVKKLKANFERSLVEPDFDVHRANAADIFQLPYNDIPTIDYLPDGTRSLRYIGKRCVHGLNYRMQPDKLAEVCNIPLMQAVRAHRLYHHTFPEIEQGWKATIELAAKERVLYTPYGRRWTLLQRISDDVFDSIIAFVPQSTIGDKVNEVLYKSQSDPRWPQNDAMIALNIHDALIAKVKIPLMKRVGKIMHDHATAPLYIKGKPLIIPAELGFSEPDEKGIHRWSTIKKYKGNVNELIT